MGTSTEYQFTGDECDVIDREKLKFFREKRKEWISWLHGDDPHSIWRQVNSLLWDEVLFRTINDLRRQAVEEPTEGVGFNGPVLQLFDAGFITTQVTAIRRLTDRSPQDSTKGVISLRRLISEIQKAVPAITREVYVSYDGLPYDPEPVQEAWIAARTSAGASFGPVWGHTKGPDAWSTSQMVHENFDKLAKISDQTLRARNDLISEDWFTWLHQQLDVCNDIRKYTDKFIAHAADLDSRTGLTDTQTGVTLNHLRTCQSTIYSVAAFIYGPLLWEGSYAALPVPQYDHLANIAKPWIKQSEVGYAYERWDHHVNEIEEWVNRPAWLEPGSNDFPPPGTLGHTR